MWRAEGDRSLQVLDSGGAIVGDSTFTTNTQNLIFVSLNGAVPVGSTVYLRPVVDFRFQTFGTPPGEVDLGGNWILGGGFDLPLRIMSLDVFPRIKVSVGQLKAPDGTAQGLIGLDASGTIRLR